MSNNKNGVEAVRPLEISLSQARQSAILCMQANIVPMLVSSPGLGKSSICKQIAEEFGLVFIDVRMAGMMPEDLNGFPIVADGKAKYVNFDDIWPTADMEIPKGKNGWFVLLDELPSAHEQVLAASYRVILDKEVGSGKKLHPACFVGAAGNKLTDNAIVNSMGTALNSRICTLNVKMVAKPTLDYMIDANFHPTVLGYLHAFQDSIHRFDPKEHKNSSFECPRTWEMVSNILKVDGTVPTDVHARAAIEGVLGVKGSNKFIAFCQIFKEIPTYAQVVADPTGCKIPDSLGNRYALMVSLVSNMDDSGTEKANKEIKAVVDYIMRIPNAEIRTVMFRIIRNTKPALYRNKDVLNLSRDTLKGVA